MDISTILIIMAIGLFAGLASGFIGIGGGIIVVPALMYFLGYSQLSAQGMSTAFMLPPIGIAAFFVYYNNGNVTKSMIPYILIMSVLFVIGAYLGSKFALKVPVKLIKLIFGLLMLYVAITMVVSGWGYFTDKSE